ncbi:MAG: RNA-guided endonuclease TnpB family protein [Rothia sp. (in: high G+C Gram-positive bacteria)]|nr:RNA-guided endonuclease TnpB family protein [Rothia sp. (in: high G+C Gram-positive bacteria)]
MTTRTVKRAYKRRFYPTETQAAELMRTFGCVRVAYNKALHYRTNTWYEQGQRISYAQTDKALTGWKKEPELAFLNEVSAVPLQQALRHLQTAFSNFFEGRARYPKRKTRRNSKLAATYTKAGFRIKDGAIYLAKMSEPLTFATGDSPVPWETVSSLTVSRDSAGRWFVSALCETEIAPLPTRGKTVGIDLGVKDALTLSTGQRLNPSDSYDLAAKNKRVTGYQRALSRKVKGSKNWEKAKLKLSRAHAAARDAKTDWLHQTTTALVRDYDVICIEDLNVAGMTKATRGKGRAAKAGLNRSIFDHNFAQFRTLLEYKAEWYGKQVVAIDRFFPSSKRCSECGTVRERLSLSARFWTCKACGARLDRDMNAAQNIHAAGLAVYACGDGVRPAKKPLAGFRGGLSLVKQETPGSDARNLLP